MLHNLVEHVLDELPTKDVLLLEELLHRRALPPSGLFASCTQDGHMALRCRREDLGGVCFGWCLRPATVVDLFGR